MCNNERIMRDEFDRKSNKREHDETSRIIRVSIFLHRRIVPNLSFLLFYYFYNNIICS